MNYTERRQLERDRRYDRKARSAAMLRKLRTINKIARREMLSR